MEGKYQIRNLASFKSLLKQRPKHSKFGNAALISKRRNTSVITTQALQDLTWDGLLELTGILQIKEFNHTQTKVSFHSIPNSYLNMESGKDLDAWAIRKVDI